MFEPFDSADSRGLVNIPFNRYSKLYGAAGKLTTHGSQHFHKQNALNAVAFIFLCLLLLSVNLNIIIRHNLQSFDS